MESELRRRTGRSRLSGFKPESGGSRLVSVNEHARVLPEAEMLFSVDVRPPAAVAGVPSGSGVFA